MPIDLGGIRPASRNNTTNNNDGYTVQRGDNLTAIARQHGMSLQDLLAANPQIKDPNLIQPGQQLNLPQAAPAAQPDAAAPAAQGPSKHTFQKGDSLSSLARQNGLSLDELKAANPNIKDPKRIAAGTEINIPQRETPTTRTQVREAGQRGGEPKPQPQGGVDPARVQGQLPVQDRPVAATTGDAMDPRNLPTTGASARTAAQDRAPDGVEGSRQMARTDENRVARFQEEFRAAGARHNIDPSILAAIASRESRGGNILDRNGLGDGGNGFGLMQVDKRSHSPQGGPYSAEHIDQAAGILAGFRDQVSRAHPDWTREQVMSTAISAYNRGARGMLDPSYDPANADRGTTGRDYASDVIARAQYYKERGF